MRHRVAGYKLGMDTQQRASVRRSIAVGVFTHGQVTTTLAKAKAVRPFVEKLITIARRGDPTCFRWERKEAFAPA